MARTSPSSIRGPQASKCSASSGPRRPQASHPATTQGGVRNTPPHQKALEGVDDLESELRPGHPPAIRHRLALAEGEAMAPAGRHCVPCAAARIAAPPEICASCNRSGYPSPPTRSWWRRTQSSGSGSRRPADVDESVSATAMTVTIRPVRHRWPDLEGHPVGGSDRIGRAPAAHGGGCAGGRSPPSRSRSSRICVRRPTRGNTSRRFSGLPRPGVGEHGCPLRSAL